jgi:hypothetical protein
VSVSIRLEEEDSGWKRNFQVGRKISNQGKDLPHSDGSKIGRVGDYLQPPDQVAGSKQKRFLPARVEPMAPSLHHRL